MEGGRDGNHLEGLRALLPAYRCLTKVTVGDGSTTSFWWDSWMGDLFLAAKFPSLLSHCNDSSASISQVVHLGLSHFLVPRLSNLAISELAELQEMVAAVTLMQQPDKRTSKFSST